MTDEARDDEACGDLSDLTADDTREITSESEGESSGDESDGAVVFMDRLGFARS
jgi:hypothetical protein